jgi:hypothetical protein
MDVAIARRAAWRGRFGNVREVDKDKTSGTRRVPGRLQYSESAVKEPKKGLRVNTNRTDSNGVVELLVDDDIVRAADWQLVEVTGQVSVAKRHRAGWVDIEQLRHIKELDTMLLSLAADDDIVLVTSDLTPDARLGCGVLGQTSEVDLWLS